MRTITTTRPQIKSVNYPERLRVVRSATVRASGARFNASAFIATPAGCWRPGFRPSDDLHPDAERALARNSQAAANVGMFAEEGKRAA